jgi:hypothetical protein
MTASPTNRSLWRQALSQRSVLWRAVKLGLTTGLLQAAVNQGDRWLANDVDAVVMLKTVISPLIGFTLVLISAAATWVDRQKELSRQAPTATGVNPFRLIGQIPQ